jgi:hypothetical protein
MAWVPLTGSEFGAHDSYEWLVTEHALEDVLSISPELVVGKYVAITAADSGDLIPDPQQIAEGWKNSGRIAYSPKITSLNVLHQEGWDEWYVFENETDLGRIADGANIFEGPMKQGEVWRFVNFNLGLHRAEMDSLAKLFWEQIETIRPQVYIADSDYHLTIVSGAKPLFTAARNAINSLDSREHEEA